MFDIAAEFDIVLSNPTYVCQEGIRPESYKNELAQRYAGATVKQSDLYCYFYAQALELLVEGGAHVFVCYNSWLDLGYGVKLQEHLLYNDHIEAIYESAIERQFSTADINTIISAIRKTNVNDKDATWFVQLRDKFELAVRPGGQRQENCQKPGRTNSVGAQPTK